MLFTKNCGHLQEQIAAAAAASLSTSSATWDTSCKNLTFQLEELCTAKLTQVKKFTK